MRLLQVGLVLASLSFPLFARPIDSPAGPTLPGTEPTQFIATIKEIRTGWNSDQFGIVTNEPMQNPAGCPTPDGYVTDSTQPGFNTFYVAAITAFVERARIVVVVAGRGCVAGRPQLIGINVLR
jgi:hypothetical protein